jgi:WD40 repeat protein
MSAMVARRLAIGLPYLCLFAVLVCVLAAGQSSRGEGLFTISQDAVARYTFSHNGNTLASLRDDRQIVVMDPLSGQEVATFPGCSRGAVTRLALSPDGQTFAIVVDATIILRDVSAGKRRTTHSGQRLAVAIALTFSPDGETLGGVAGSTEILVWELASSSLRCSQANAHAVVAGIAFSADGALLASYGADDQIKL